MVEGAKYVFIRNPCLKTHLTLRFTYFTQQQYRTVSDRQNNRAKTILINEHWRQ